MEGSRLNRQELIDKFGISNRLAIRVGALMAKNTLLSEAVLESAGPGSAMEKALLHPAILEKAEGLDKKTLDEIIAEKGPIDDALTVFVKGEERIIALEEEVLAEKGFAGDERKESEGKSDTAIAQRGKPEASDIFRAGETRRLFTPDEVARLKLDAMTSADPAMRISAIRRLRYAPLSDREKGGIYLQALLDPVAPVRNEAITALESLGFDPDTSRSLRGMFSEEESERRISLDRLFALLEHMTRVEAQIILAVLLEAFREFSSPDSRRRILAFLADSAGHVAAYRDYAAETIKAAVSKMMANPSEMERAVESFLLALAKEAPDLAASVLKGELDTIRDPNIRAALLGVIAECVTSPQEKRAVALDILDGMTHEDLREINRQKIGRELISLGEPAAGPLLERFASGEQREKKMLIGLLDALCVERPASADMKSSVASKLLDALSAADPVVRLDISSARLFRDPAVPDRLRAQLARTMARDLARLTHPDAANVLSDALESLGAPSVTPLMEAVRRDESEPRAAELAARILARLFVFQRHRLPDADTMTEDFLKFLMRKSRDEKTPGGYLWSLGLVGGSFAGGEKRAREIFELLRNRLGRLPYHADIIGALGYMAAGQILPLAEKIQVAHVLATLLDRHEQEKDDDLLIRRETLEGIVYEFAPRAEFDSVALPVAVDAARRFCLSPHVSPALRRNMLERMIRVWNKVARWEVIWGPRSSESLARALGEVGADQASSPADRERIGRALSQDIRRMSVVRALKLLAEAGGETSRLDEILSDAAERILDYWMDSDIAPEEREIVLRSAAAIASRPQLPTGKKSARLKRSVAGSLMELLRLGEYWTREPLEILRDSKGATRELTREIDKTLREILAIRKR